MSEADTGLDSSSVDQSDNSLDSAKSDRKVAFFFVQLSFGLVGTTIFGALYETARRVYWTIDSTGYPDYWQLAIGQGAFGAELAQIDRFFMVMTLSAIWLLSFLGIQVLEEHSERSSYPASAILSDLGIAVLLYLTAESIQHQQATPRPTDSLAWLGLGAALIILFVRLLTGPTVFKVKKPDRPETLQVRSRASVALLRVVVMLALLGPLVFLRPFLNSFAPDHLQWVYSVHVAALTTLGLLALICGVVARRVFVDQEMRRFTLGPDPHAWLDYNQRGFSLLYCWQIVWRRIRAGMFLVAGLALLLLVVTTGFKQEVLFFLETQALTIPISPLCVAIVVVGGGWAALGFSPESRQDEVLLPSFTTLQETWTRKLLRRLELDLRELWALDTNAYIWEVEIFRSPNNSQRWALRTSRVQRRFHSRVVDFYRWFESYLLWFRPRRRREEAQLRHHPGDFLWQFIDACKFDEFEQRVPKGQPSAIFVVQFDERTSTIEPGPRRVDARSWDQLGEGQAVMMTPVNWPRERRLLRQLNPHDIRSARALPPDLSLSGLENPIRIRLLVLMTQRDQVDDLLEVGQDQIFTDYITELAPQMEPDAGPDEQTGSGSPESTLRST